MLEKKAFSPKTAFVHQADRILPPYTKHLDTDEPEILFRFISSGQERQVPCGTRMYKRAVGRKLAKGASQVKRVVGALNRMARAKFLVVTEDDPQLGEKAVGVHVIPDEQQIVLATQDDVMTMRIRVNTVTGEMEIEQTVANATLNMCYNLLKLLQQEEKISPGDTFGTFTVTRAEGDVLELELVEG